MYEAYVPKGAYRTISPQETTGGYFLAERRGTIAFVRSEYLYLDSESHFNAPHARDNLANFIRQSSAHFNVERIKNFSRIQTDNLNVRDAN